MSHLIIKPYDTVYCPSEGMHKDTWHNLQTNVDGRIAEDGSNVPNVMHPIYSCGFKPDFEAKVADCPIELQDELGKNPISDWKVLLADLSKHPEAKSVIPIHVAKGGYTVHQNRLLWDAFIPSVRKVRGNDFEIATVGTLGAYSQFFISVALGKDSDLSIGTNDKWRLYYNLIASHNGLVSSQRNLCGVRVVCMNTVRMSIASAEENHEAIKHTKNSLDLITPELFAESLERWLHAKAELEKALRAMQSVPMTLEQFKAFAAGVFTLHESDALSTTSFNRVEEMAVLFARGRGNSGVSAYDALNAFTEYFTSGNGVGSAKVKASKKIASANFGRGNDWKLEAMRCLATEEDYKDALERGERLLTDKLIADAKAKAKAKR